MFPKKVPCKQSQGQSIWIFTFSLLRKIWPSAKEAISGPEYLKFVYSFCKKDDQMQKKEYPDQRVLKYVFENQYFRKKSAKEAISRPEYLNIHIFTSKKYDQVQKRQYPDQNMGGASTLMASSRLSEILG